MRTWKMYSCISCFDNISLAKEQITYSQASTEIRQLIVGKSEDRKTKKHPSPQQLLPNHSLATVTKHNSHCLS